MPKLAARNEATKVSTPYNLRGAVAPSELTGHQFHVEMLVDAINFHENGDDEDPACCTGDSPCRTRIELVRQQREVSAKIQSLDPRTQSLDPGIGRFEDRLAAAGRAPVSTGSKPVQTPASEKSVKYALSLADQHSTEGIGSFKTRTLADLREGKEVSQRRVSTLIDWLKTQPRTQQTKAADQVRTETPQPRTPERTSGEAVEDGMYRKDGQVYKVQVAIHGSGRPYAKKLVEGEGAEGNSEWYWVKAPGMQFKLTAADKMTLDEAKEWGKLYGTCCVCGRTLTDETSIAEGIGPKCGNRF